MKKLLFIVSIILCGSSALKGQVDPHFSQYYAYPMWLNPALTGVFDGDMRINLNAKQQWSGLGGGYNTAGVSMDFLPAEKLAIGINILDQAAGTAGYNYFTGYGSIGYGIAVSEDGMKKLHFGLQAGVINRSFDPSKLQLDDQWNPITGFDAGSPSFETFTTTNAMIFDASVGAFYYDSDPEHNANLFGGISVAHLTQPKDPFAIGGLNSKLPMRYTLHGGMRFKANDDVDITPHLLYISQQHNQIKAFGVYSEIKTQDDKGLVLGAMYRWNDAAIADVGYHLGNLTIGLSYDFNTSALNTASNGQGGFELSVSYIFHKRTQGPAPVCPRF